MLAMLLVIVTQANAQAISERQTTVIVQDTVRTQAASNGVVSILRRVIDDCTDRADCEAKLAQANRRINQLIDEAEKSDLAFASSQAEVVAWKAVADKADERIRGLLDIIKQYASVPVKERKAWWKVVLRKLTDLVDVATDAKTLAAIAEIVILIKATER